MTGGGDVENRLSSREFKIPFRRRLGRSWKELADWVGIAWHERKAFEKGEEPDEIWIWLEERERLAELPDALRGIDRSDLADLAEQTPGVVYVRLDTHPHDHVFRKCYDRAITSARYSAVLVEDVPRGDGRRPDLHFAAYRAEDIVSDEGSRDVVQRLFPPGVIGMVHFFLVGPAEARAHAAGKIWDWLSDSELSGLLPRRVLNEKDLEIELTSRVRKLVTIREGSRPASLLDDAFDSPVGGL